MRLHCLLLGLAQMGSKCRPISTAELWEIICAGHGWDPYPHGKNPDGSPAGLVDNMPRLSPILAKLVAEAPLKREQ